jgi:hypothetical protein
VRDWCNARHCSGVTQPVCHGTVTFHESFSGVMQAHFLLN